MRLRQAFGVPLRGAVLLVLASVSSVAGQSAEIPLWPGVAPGSEASRQREVRYQGETGEAMVRNVVRPTLTPYLPDPADANGTAVVIAPGGAFVFLSWEMEGTRLAEWLRSRGYAAFLLKYRLMDSGTTDADVSARLAEVLIGARGNADAPPMPAVSALGIADGQQAIRLVRQRAAEWRISPDRVGIIGFSAGAYLAMGVVLESDLPSRPNFAAPIYGPGLDRPAVPPDAPPLFIVAADNDPLIPSSGSANLYLAWRAAGRPAELHIYARGGHGFGMKRQNLPSDDWIDRFGAWLAVNGLARRQP